MGSGEGGEDPSGSGEWVPELGEEGADRESVAGLAVSVAAVGVVVAIATLFEPTTLTELALQWVAVLGVATLTLVALVRLYVPDFEEGSDFEGSPGVGENTDIGAPTVDSAAESPTVESAVESPTVESAVESPTEDGSGATRTGDRWRPSALDVGVTLGFAVLIVVGGRLAVAFGTVGSFAFLAAVFTLAGASFHWLADSDASRLTDDTDHPYHGQSFAVRHRFEILGNLGTWAALALVVVLFRPELPVSAAGRDVLVPWYAFVTGAAVCWGLTHRLLVWLYEP